MEGVSLCTEINQWQHKNNTEIFLHVIYYFVFTGRTHPGTLLNRNTACQVRSTLLRLQFLTQTTAASSFHYILSLLLLHNQQQEINGFLHNVFHNMRVWLWCHLLFSVKSPPPTLNVSCYRAQRSSVVYFPMMLSAMWLTPLRGEGNQPFHLQRRGNVEVLADSIFSSAILTMPEPSFTLSVLNLLDLCGPISPVAL